MTRSGKGCEEVEAVSCEIVCRLCRIQDQNRHQHEDDKRGMVEMVAVFAFNEGIGWNKGVEVWMGGFGILLE